MIEEVKKDVLIFMSSTAHHKFKMYRQLAEEEGIRLHILPVEMIYRTMAEGDEIGGSTEANAMEKTHLVSSVFTHLTSKKRKEIFETIAAIIEELGLVEPITLVATDDAAVTFDKETWVALPKEGTEQVLKNFAEDLEGPAAEYGPFIGARGGIIQFLKDVRGAARKQTKDGSYKVLFSDQTTLILSQLILNYSEKNFIFSSETVARTSYAVSEIAFEKYKKGIRPDKKAQLSKVSPATIADVAHVESTIQEGRLHVPQRRAILKDIAEIYHIAEGKPARFSPQRNLKVALVGSAATSRLLEKEIYQISRHADVESISGDNLETLIGSSDAFIIACSDKEHPRKHVNYAALVHSLTVAKQTDGRDFNKPIGLVEINSKRRNHASVMKRITSMHKNMAGMGMAKEGEYANVQNFPGATIYHSNYFFYVSAKDQRAANNAIGEVLKNEFGYYRPVKYENKSVTTETRHAGLNPTDKTVAIMCSAGNQNDMLRKGSFEIAKFLVSEGYNISYGAMDKYMGGAIIDGFKDGLEEFKGNNPKAEKKPALIGVSTPVLMGRETSKGKLNEDIDVKIITPDLTRRTNKILRPLNDKPADIVTILPGGIGTLVEKIEVNLHNNKGKRTPIIVWNPPFPSENNRFWDVILKDLSPIVFPGMYKKGDKPHELLNTKNTSTKAKEFRKKTGMYVVNNLTEYKRVFKELSSELGHEPEIVKQAPIR